jgi:hypothetical protein
VLLKDFNQFPKESGYLYLVGIPILFAVGVLLTAFYVYEKQKNSINDYLAY